MSEALVEAVMPNTSSNSLENAQRTNTSNHSFDADTICATDTPDSSKDVLPPSLIPKSIWREGAMVLTVCFGQLMSLAPLGQVLAPLHIIGDSFGNRDPTQLSWYLAAYSLTTGTFILVMGRLGDLCGHRLMFALGYVWLAVWSLVAGLTIYTGSEIFFDVCRGLQGIGGAMLVPNGVAILGRLYPPGPRKAVVFCLFGACGPTGFLTGALFSSLVAQLAWWPWAFFLMTIVATALFVSVLVFVPDLGAVEDSSTDASQEQKSTLRNTKFAWVNKFDWPGSLTGVTGLILFNIAWNQGPSVGWSTGYVIAFIVLGVVFFATFLVIEKYVTHPIVPVKDISSKVFLVLGCVALGWAGFGIWVYYWFEFVEVIQGNTPLTAVAQHSAALPAAYIAALFVSRIVLKVKACWILLGASIAFCGGSIITVLTQPQTLYWKQLFWGVLLMPFGMDMSFPASTLLLSDLVSHEHQGLGASLVVTTINYSIALGLGVAGTVEVHFNDGGRDALSGGRSAQWTGVGMTAAGILVACYFVVSDVVVPRIKARNVVLGKPS